MEPHYSSVCIYGFLSHFMTKYRQPRRYMPLILEIRDTNRNDVVTTTRIFSNVYSILLLTLKLVSKLGFSYAENRLRIMFEQ